MRFFKKTIFGLTLNTIILLSDSSYCLAKQPITATFTRYAITSNLVNGQQLGNVVFNTVRQEDDHNFNMTGYYPTTGLSIQNNPPGYDLCTTNVDGIGVQYISGANGALLKDSCANSVLNSDYIFQWTPAVWGYLNQINKEIMRFVVYDARKLSSGGNFTITSLADNWIDSTKKVYGSVNISPSITFNIPSQKKAAIYFPDYPSGDPNIKVPLKIGGRGYPHLYASGQKRLKMCLADDNGINSSQFQLIFNDLSAYPGSGDSFHLNRQGGGSTDSDFVNYQITITNPLTNSEQNISINNPIIWNNLNRSTVEIANYTVNGKTLACVPTPLTIKVPTFNYSSKSSGMYTSTVSIIFTPTLNN